MDDEIKRHFISRAQADAAEQDRVSPCFYPLPPPTSLASVAGAAPLTGGHSSYSDAGIVGHLAQ